MSYFCNVIKELPKHKQLILFDGVCNLCNDSVLKVIKNDKKSVFLFTAIESDAGQKIINHLGKNLIVVVSV